MQDFTVNPPGTEGFNGVLQPFCVASVSKKMFWAWRLSIF